MTTSAWRRSSSCSRCRARRTRWCRSRPAARSPPAGSTWCSSRISACKPGDFVTYYARARDVGQGRRGTETRSDIFFLEVKPFEEEFVAAQSQAMGMQGGGSQLQELAEAQKEIIAATWKLDARARRARDAGRPRTSRRWPRRRPS